MKKNCTENKIETYIKEPSHIYFFSSFQENSKYFFKFIFFGVTKN